MITDEIIIDKIYPEDIEFKFLQSFDEPVFGFILKTFTQFLHKSYPHNFIPNNIFYPQQNKILRSIISNGAKCLVASLKGSPDDFFGYIIADDRIPGYLIVHWIFIKGTWRKMNVAQQLLNYFDYDKKEIIITQATNDFKSFNKKMKLIYNPYLWTS